MYDPRQMHCPLQQHDKQECSSSKQQQQRTSMQSGA
jgi:hypothetical protein